ncbi:MAG: hypothetical protein WBX01_16210 [Nitrososphaeraceae archaeon]
MSKNAAIYLAHLNPVTKSHSNIISRLSKEYQVYLFPVRFVNKRRELNTRSFPFNFETRKSMVEELFGDSVKIVSAYTFRAPFLRYVPPLISPYSWTMRKEILESIVENKFFSYTGDRAESWMLKMYGLRPKLGKRLEISGTFVRDLLYRDAIHPKRKSNGREPWHNYVPPQVAEIIYKNWTRVEQFAHTNDRTVRLFGMKFPQEGLLSP